MSTQWKEEDYKSFKHMLECFVYRLRCAHKQKLNSTTTGVKFKEAFSTALFTSIKGHTTYKDYWKGFGGNGHSTKITEFEKMTERWELKNDGNKLRMAIIQDRSKNDFMGRTCYVFWLKPTSYNGKDFNVNIAANWEKDDINSLILYYYYTKDSKYSTTDIRSYTLNELGLYDDEEPNDKLKECLDLYTAMRDDVNTDGNYWVNWNSSHANIPSTPSHPLNLILYGPPGTGKTYNTVNKALDIIDGKIPAKREDAKKRYDELVEQGQIVFTTFHQSMSYEDFIEGIKPETDSKTKQVTYSVKPGIFKKICKDANDNRLQSKEEPSTKNHNYIQSLLNAFFDPLRPSKSGNLNISFKNKSYPITLNSPTSYTVQLTPNAAQNLTLSIIERDYENFKKGNIKSYKDIKPSRPSKSKEHGNARLYWGLYQALKEFEDKNNKDIATEEDKEPLKNFVLIIDEINRGNIANIFGELISLIEESKRLGNDEYLTAELPYSSSMTNDDDIEPFGVPNNLYIIGTMNTADRSVEALDTALRRRFSFEEMMPDPELLKEKDANGKVIKEPVIENNTINYKDENQIKNNDITLSKLLETINKRIEILKDREHQIGHSYFMGHDGKDDSGQDKYPDKKEWLKNVFKDKIIPLLQEYFYGDYKKIYYVLGPGFVKIINDNKPENIFPVKIDDDFDIDENIVRYEIKSFDEINIEEAVKDLISSIGEKEKKKKKEKMKEQLRKEGYKEKDIIEIVEKGKDKSEFTPEPIPQTV